LEKPTRKNTSANRSNYASEANYIKVDSIDGKPMESFWWNRAKRKGVGIIDDEDTEGLFFEE